MTDEPKALPDGSFDPEVFRQDVEIEENNLNLAFLRQAALFAYYGSLHAAALRRESRAKLMMEVEEAKVAKGIRDRFTAELEAFEADADPKAKKTGPKLTETQIEQEVKRTPSYIKAVNAYNEAKANTALAHTAVEAFRHRRDMLVQLGADRREEMKGELRAYGPGKLPQAA